MESRPHFHVKKRTLLAIAGCVWLLAGFNVARLGVISYGALPHIGIVRVRRVRVHVFQDEHEAYKAHKRVSGALSSGVALL